MLYREQCAVHALVRTARHTPETIETSNALRLVDLPGRHPMELHTRLRHLRSKLERDGNRLVRPHPRVVVADESNGDLLQQPRVPQFDAATASIADSHRQRHQLPDSGTATSMFASRVSSHLPLTFRSTESVWPARFIEVDEPGGVATTVRRVHMKAHSPAIWIS